MAVVFKWTGSNAVVDVVSECIPLILQKPLFKTFDDVEKANYILQNAVENAVVAGDSDEWRSVRLDAQTNEGVYELTINPVFGWKNSYSPFHPFQQHRDAAIKAWRLLYAAAVAAYRNNQQQVVILVSRYSQVDCALSKIVFTQRSNLVNYMQRLPLKVRQNKQIIAKALDINGAWLQFCPDGTKKDLKQVLLAVQTCPDAFKFAAQELKESKEAVLAAVEVNCNAYIHAAPLLQRDRDVVLAACCKSRVIATIVFGSDDPDLSCFAHDETVALATIKASTCTLWDFKHLQNNRDFVLAVVAFNGLLLKGASTPLKNTDDVVDAAIQSNASAVRFASARLKACLKTATLAVTKCAQAIKYVDTALHSDRELLKVVASTGGVDALKLVKSPLKHDLQLHTMALERDAEVRRLHAMALERATLKCDANEAVDTFF